MGNNDNKKKYAYWMRPPLVTEMESMLGEANADSKSEFVCQAIRFYIGYLRQQKNIDYLAPILAQTIKAEVESVEQNLSRVLFQVAVEQSKLSHLFAAFHEIDDETMARLQHRCAYDVSHTGGTISFESAYDFQHKE